MLISEDFEIEDLGVESLYVYDIEIEDNHNFFANDILVHNSAYISIAPFMDTLPESMPIQKKVDTADLFCKQVISPIIDQCSNEICSYMNCYEQKMVWGREVIAEEAIWLAMKNYFMNVWDSEGVRFTDEPKFKMTGVEAVKSSYPMYAKTLLIKCYQLALKGDEAGVQALIEQATIDFDKYDVNSIAIPTKVNGIEDYYDEVTLYKKGAQMHVKAAINHNVLLERLNVDTIPPIDSGDSIKYLELKKPNPYNFEVIGFDTKLPKEFGLEKYVNRKVIFNKGFMIPLRRVLDTMNWTEEETVTLF